VTSTRQLRTEAPGPPDVGPNGLEALRHWMDDAGLGSGELSDMTSLSGGTQNVMVRLRRSGREYILRRGPRHLRARSNKNILREISILDALASTDVPHPRLVAACDDTSVLGDAVFYLMETVDGYNASVSLSPLAAKDPSLRHEMGLRLADVLAGIAAVDHERVGLSTYGQPDGFLARQVDRWLAELESYSQLVGYGGPELPGLDGIAAWLTGNQPVASPPGILHGDYHVANVMFQVDSPTIVAVVDWEMSTIGDPLVDLGALLAVWPESEGRDDLIGSALSRSGGLPTEADLVERYAQRSVRDLRALDWYVVLAAFKLGILLEGSHARAQAGLADPATGDRLHALALSLMSRARRRMAS
jgi:aminoglycoside phosphotransferase (APT) family kinase protein